MKKTYFEPQCSIRFIQTISITTTSVEGSGDDFSGDGSWSNNAPSRSITRDAYENYEN